MRSKIIVICILLISSLLSAQNLVIEKFIPLKFQVNDFSINENRNFIFLTSTETNEIIKIDINGKVLKKIGGFGWSDGQFDYPSGIASTAIDIYISDYNNHRIQRFDQNLNFISSLNKNEQLNFEFPVSISLSTKGDLYILDAKNKRILKINALNRLERIFGNYESGQATLKNPKKLRNDNLQRLWVLDDREIKIFDQFGNYLSTTSFLDKLDSEIVDFYPDKSSLFILTKNRIYELSNKLTDLNLELNFDFELNFKAIEIRQERIYILDSEGIFICKKED